MQSGSGTGTGRLVQDNDDSKNDDMAIDYDKFNFMNDTPEALSKRYRKSLEKEFQK